MRTTSLVIALAALACVGACNPEEPAQGTAPPPASAPEPAAEPEVVSLLGTPLFRPELTEPRRALLEGNLETAQGDYDANPDGEDETVWLGRRTAYLSRYGQAVDIYTRGLMAHPESYRLMRHRGHRFISLRRFDDAIADLTRAAELAAEHDDEIEPDGIPNRINQPLSTTKFNIWYHLALAHYLSGDFEAALAAYEECMKVSSNPDLLVATTDWMYMTLRRLGRHAEAEALLEPISADLEIIENDAYHRRLLMYKGEMAPQELLDLRAEEDPDLALNIATQGYGVGNWFLVEGDRSRAREIFERIVEGSSWAAFGFIAAEADLARLGPEG